MHQKLTQHCKSIYSIKEIKNKELKTYMFSSLEELMILFWGQDFQSLNNLKIRIKKRIMWGETHGHHLMTHFHQLSYNSFLSFQSSWYDFIKTVERNSWIYIFWRRMFPLLKKWKTYSKICFINQAKNKNIYFWMWKSGPQVFVKFTMWIKIYIYPSTVFC